MSVHVDIHCNILNWQKDTLIFKEGYKANLFRDNQDKHGWGRGK